MGKELYLSLCIPTNGIIEWVVPVIESIYVQNCDNDYFEVIVTDNGDNLDFQTKMHEYEDKYNNFHYQKTEAIMFLNQIESFKLAKGKLIKFVNHRMTMLPGSLEYLIGFSKEYINMQPVVYFSNGVLRLQPSQIRCSTFDEYVKTLSYWSSWSAGTAIWKDNFNKINLNIEFNKLFPHTDIIFFDKKHDGYLVDDKELFSEIPTNVTKKGNYDLFNAFCIEYPAILMRLKDENKISENTLNYVLKKNGHFISELYLEYIIKKTPCSYNLNGYKNAVKIYYSDFEIRIGACGIRIKKLLKRMLDGNK